MRGERSQSICLIRTHVEAGADSDVDVFIDKDKSRPFGFDEFMDIYFLLCERLGDKVDYGTRDGFSPALRQIVEREAIRVF